MPSKLFIPKQKMPKATQSLSKDVGKTIRKYTMRDKIVKTGEGENDYIIVKEQVLVSEIDRQEYINSFADDVGILNILKKVAITGDASAYAAQASQGIDSTILPDNKMEAHEKVLEGVKAFDALPDEIKKKMTMEMFVKAFGQKEFDEYIASKVQALKVDDKGGQQ